MKRGAAGRLRPPAARGWAPCSRQLPAGRRRRRLPRPPQRQPSRAGGGGSGGSAPCSAPRVLPSSGAARAWPPPAPRPRGLAPSPRGRHSAPGSQAAAAPRGAEGTRRAPRGAGRGRSRPPRAPREDGEVGDGRRGRASGGVRLPRGGAPLPTLPRSPGPEPTAERPARLGTYQPAWDNAAPGTSAMV